MDKNIEFKIYKYNEQESINKALNILISCGAYTNEEKIKVLDCANSIFIAITTSGIIVPQDRDNIGIIGCKRIFFEESNLEFLKYYPNKNNYLYKIEFIHINSSYLDMEYREKVLYELIETCLKDKNECASIIDTSCIKEYNEDLIPVLINKCNFNITKDKNNNDVYVRYPILHN